MIARCKRAIFVCSFFAIIGAVDVSISYFLSSVLIAGIFNTAIVSVVDLVSPGSNDLAKKLKMFLLQG